MTHEEIRQAFEKWYSDGNRYMAALERNGEGYRLMQAQQAWHVWYACAKTLAAAQPTCTYPLCQSEAEQQRLGREIIADMIGEPAQGDDFCDAHCTWRDHHPECSRNASQPAQGERQHVHTWTPTQIVGVGAGQICGECGELRDAQGRAVYSDK